MLFDLPTSLAFGGREWPINSDFRDVLRTLAAFADPDLTDGEKAAICLHNTYPDWTEIPREQLQAAFDAAIGFIDQGRGDDGRPRAACPEISDSGQAVFAEGKNCPPNSEGLGRAIRPRTMDWEQDAALIFPAVNRVAGFEVRGAGFVHWWTFLGYFMEIHDSTCATVLGLRAKRARGRRLEKDEQEFWQRNRALCELKPRLSRAEREERALAERIIGNRELLRQEVLPKGKPFGDRPSRGDLHTSQTQNRKSCAHKQRW